jgi:methylglutaconyl-CoA hydratase
MFIADKDTIFALSEVKLGLIPATISPYVLAAIGSRQARRYFQTGERFTGARAYELGLVHELTSSDDEMNDVLTKILKHVASNGPLAMREAKRLILDFAGQPIGSELMEESAERIAAIRARPEAKEGLTAFFEKRKASWVRDEN